MNNLTEYAGFEYKHRFSKSALIYFVRGKMMDKDIKHKTTETLFYLMAVIVFAQSFLFTSYVSKHGHNKETYASECNNALSSYQVTKRTLDDFE